MKNCFFLTDIYLKVLNSDFGVTLHLQKTGLFFTSVFVWLLANLILSALLDNIMMFNSLNNVLTSTKMDETSVYHLKILRMVSQDCRYWTILAKCKIIKLPAVWVVFWYGSKLKRRRKFLKFKTRSKHTGK